MHTDSHRLMLQVEMWASWYLGEEAVFLIARSLLVICASFVFAEGIGAITGMRSELQPSLRFAEQVLRVITHLLLSLCLLFRSDR